MGNVRRSDHDHVPARLQAVHQCQQLRDQAALCLALAAQLVALGGDRVDLVKEDDRRGPAACFLEDLAQMGFAGAIPLVDDLGPVHVEEPRAGLVGHGAGDQRFAAARGAIEQHAFGGIDAQPLEQLGEAQRQLDHLADAAQLTM